MAVIVAFGDSNTWGYDPAEGGRLTRDARWTGVMAATLGPDHQVIEEGLNGRTTVFLDPTDPNWRGADYLTPCLRSHAPLDLVIIALGCNDMKAQFKASAAEIASGAEQLVTMAQAEPVGPGGAPPSVLLVAPPPIAKLTGFAEMFRGAEPKSHESLRATLRSQSGGASASSMRGSSSTAPISMGFILRPTSTKCSAARWRKR